MVYEEAGTPTHDVHFKVHFPDAEAISSCQADSGKSVSALGWKENSDWLHVKMDCPRWLPLESNPEVCVMNSI